MRACRSAAFRSAGLTRCGLQPVCEERGTTRQRPGVVPPDKALGARREGVRESAGSGIREISDAQGARPRRPLRVFTLNCIYLFERTAAGGSGKAGSRIPAADQGGSLSGTPGPATPGLGRRGKSLDPKGWGRTKSLWKTSPLSHCLSDWGSCGGEDAVVLPPGAPPPPPLSPLSVRTHQRRFLLLFPCLVFVCVVCFFFHSIFFPIPFYFFHLSSLLAFLRRKASLSVFTADLDLNVHTIKARGECQEWGRLSAVVREDPPRKEPRSRGALRRAQRCGFRLEGSRAPGRRSPWRGEVCDV
uniref:Uncharacterized protein n=1 Tax=Myotis myotis TaxID=51298 RepID=A0A7J7XHI3_MYOMY|nr:hypothetical protein mMyoMyo1_011711 [Myotis myotis]